MQAPIELSAQDARSRWLQQELKLDPTRMRAILRITACTVIVVVIAMVFQIPLPAYVAYLVFMVSHDDAASTLVTAIGGVVAVTLAVAVSVLFYVFDAAEPALRIPLLAASTLAGTFLARTSPLGPIAFLAGFVLVLSQTLLDDVPSTEAVTHAVLWLWVIVALPATATVIANLLAGESPVALGRQRAAQLMEQVAAYIENPYATDPLSLRSALLSLSELTHKAVLWNKRIKLFAQEDGRLLALLLEVLQIARYLPPSVSPAARLAMAAKLRQARSVFLRRRGLPADSIADPPGLVATDADAVHAALRSAIDALLHEASGNAAGADTEKRPAAPRRLLIEGALTNRSHGRFAFKVMCAVLASYATYTLLDWPGIRTAVTTCFFVALTTFGESVHKWTLRVFGAIIGGLLAGLSIVFVLPYLTDIGQLCLLIALVSAVCAWISTSSETIAYAGMQIAFAFFLCVLQGYGPTTDLTELRDRIVGIIVGNVWISIFFTVLWPVSTRDQAREKWAATLGQLSRLVLANHAAELSTMRSEICKQAAEASKLNARALFEWRFLARAKHADRPPPEAAQIERLMSATFVVARLKQDAVLLPSDEAGDQLVAQRLLALSKGALSERDEGIAATSSSLRGQARERLNQEIDHASRTI